jgi:hypothetical protein
LFFLKVDRMAAVGALTIGEMIDLIAKKRNSLKRDVRGKRTCASVKSLRSAGLAAVIVGGRCGVADIRTLV